MKSQSGLGIYVRAISFAPPAPLLCFLFIFWFSYHRPLDLKMEYLVILENDSYVFWSGKNSECCDKWQSISYGDIKGRN